ncbi:MAG: hypothetical protein UH854_00365, partial [Clostridia bacterium]|nr:hypothetical protein [Clostridia bacterium]
MNKLKVGFAKVNINPPLGIGVSGYYIPRYASGFLDDLEASAMVLSVDNKNIAIISVDNCLINTNIADDFRTLVEKDTGIARENIFLSATHTHTGPHLALFGGFEVDIDVVNKYREFVQVRIVDAVKLALLDLKPARMGYIVGYAPERVAYIRRYKMKDGSTMTCPPVNNPDIDYPLGELDQRINVLRFDRDGGNSIVLVNYGLHSDTVNGDMISSDWPGWMRRTLDKALDGVESMFICGAQGDVGSTNVNPKDGDMNDTEISFDNEMKSPGMARFVGRAIAGTVLQVYDKVHYIDIDEIDVIHKEVLVPANVPDPADLPLARKYKELHDAGKDNEIPFEAMELTTVVAEAERMCALANGPENFCLDLTGVRIGDVAMIGIPG